MDDRISALLRAAAADPAVITLAGGLPSAKQFPTRGLALSFLRVMRQSGTPALQYGWAEGSDGLRAFIAQRLGARGAEVSVDDIVVTSGAQQAIAIALELCSAPGDEIGVDPESYPAALELFRCRELRPVARFTGASCAYVMPVVSNPRGRSLSPADRSALLSSAMPIIEDDAYADLRFTGPASTPLCRDAPNRVFHVGTFSKTLCPGLRVGWLVVPHHLRQRALDLKQGVDLQASSLSQAIVEDYLLGNPSRPGIDFDRRVAGLRLFYERRAIRMARALRRHLPTWSFQLPEGGFALWVETNAVVPETDFLARAVQEGVTFDPGSMFRSGERHGESLDLRLCFSYASADSFDEGIQRLARAWAAVSGASSRAIARPRASGRRAAAGRAIL